MPQGGLKLALETGRPAGLDQWTRTSASPRLRLAVAVGMVVFATVWLLHLDFTSLVPPVDDLEQLTWARSVEWGYYKHPPLPTWLVWPALHVFGWSAWVVYVTGAAMTAATFWILWRLLAKLRGEPYALVALLAAACITYYNGRLNYFNHDVVLLLANAACAALAWQAFATRRLRWWLVLGLVVGLGALAKYQVAVTVASILVFAAHQRAWEQPVHRRGCLLAAGVAFAVFAPHLAWLGAHGWPPLRYAMESSLGVHLGLLARWTDSLSWLLDQLLNRALPAWLLLGAAAATARRVTTSPSTARHTSAEGRAARALLLSWGIVPLLFMPAVGVLFGADLPKHWRTPFLLFAVPAMMELTPRPWTKVSVGPAAVVAFIGIQGLLLLVSHLSSPMGLTALRRDQWQRFDARTAADSIGAPAREQLGGPIRFVSGPPAVAAALALQWPEAARVLIDGRLDRSPWIDEAQLRACGRVELVAPGSSAEGTPVGPALPDWQW